MTRVCDVLAAFAMMFAVTIITGFFCEIKCRIWGLFFRLGAGIDGKKAGSVKGASAPRSEPASTLDLVDFYTR